MYDRLQPMFSNHILRGFSPPLPDLRYSTSPSAGEFRLGVGTEKCQEVTKNLQLTVNSVAVESQGASRYHFNKDCKSPEKQRKVIEANPGGKKSSKSQGEEWEGRERAVFD